MNLVWNSENFNSFAAIVWKLHYWLTCALSFPEAGLERYGSVATKSIVGRHLKPMSDKNTRKYSKSTLMIAENHGFVSEQGTCETSECNSTSLWKDGLHWVRNGSDSIGKKTNTTWVSN